MFLKVEPCFAGTENVLKSVWSIYHTVDAVTGTGSAGEGCTNGSWNLQLLEHIKYCYMKVVLSLGY